MKWIYFFLCICPLFASTPAASESSPLQFFLIPHSHCDAGWTSTFEQYYVSKVQYILNTVVDCLLEQKDRKFNWAEVGYFAKWWNLQSAGRRSQVKLLITSGQLEFLGNGWVQQDEAGSCGSAAAADDSCDHYLL